MSFLALDAYAKRYSITGQAFEAFLFFMGCLDAEWLEHVAEQAKVKKNDR